MAQHPASLVARVPETTDFATPGQPSFCRTLVRPLANPPFLLAAFLFLASFAAARIWFFTDYPLAGIRADSDSYFQVVRAMDAGRLPDFSIRSPGYPLFMKLVFSVSNTITGVVIAQTVLSALSGLYMLYGIHRFRRSLAPWAAVGMAAYYVGNLALEHDTDLLPEALYVDFILFAFASLFLALTTKKGLFFAISSAGIGAAILTKPAGLFLVAVYVMVILFALLNRYGARRAICFVLPFPLIMLGLSIYNYAVVGIFTPTAFGESQIAFTTFTFWEQDERYPGDVNAAIGSAQQKMSDILTKEDRQMLSSPFALDQRQKFSDAFLKGFSYPTLDAANAVGRGDYMVAREWIRIISLDSIKKHPDVYAKFVETQLASWYLDNITFQPDFVDSLEGRATQYYVEKRYSAAKGNPGRTALAKEFADPPVLAGVQILGVGDDARVRLTSTSLPRRIYESIHAVRNAIFSSAFWSLAPLVILVLAGVRLAASRGTHIGAFLLVAMIFGVIAASLVVALVEIALVRYSYSTEWAYYLSIAVAPALLLGNGTGREDDRGGAVVENAGPAGMAE